MKKIITLLALSMLLASCGNEINSDTTMVEDNEAIVVDNQAPVEEVLTEDEINAAIEDLFSDTAE